MTKFWPIKAEINWYVQFPKYVIKKEGVCPPLCWLKCGHTTRWKPHGEGNRARRQNSLGSWWLHPHLNKHSRLTVLPLMTYPFLRGICIFLWSIITHVRDNAIYTKNQFQASKNFKSWEIVKWKISQDPHSTKIHLLRLAFLLFASFLVWGKPNSCSLPLFLTNQYNF